MSVSVEFVDSVTGRTIARSDLPAERLPASFDIGTTVTIGTETWSVVRAEPPTAAEFRATGRLVLTLTRVTVASPHDILYSLPTLCDRLPAMEPAAADPDRLELHEDDWRQVELVCVELTGVVADQFAAIRRIHDEQSVDGVGYRTLHVRTGPEAPLPRPVPLHRLRETLAPQRTYAGVGFRGAPGAAIGSFAYGYGPVDLYGLSVDGAATVLALRTTGPGSALPTGLGTVMRTFGLILVDWCRCTAVDADALGAR